MDDQTSIEKLDMSNTDRMTVNGCRIDVKKAIKSENVFRRNANNIGIVVNSENTTVLDILSATTYSHILESYIRDSEKNIIDCNESMKALGFHFSRCPNASLHVEKLEEKIKKRIWSLRYLRGRGFQQADLLKVYIAMIRSVAEYCQVAYHTLITKEESKSLDWLEIHIYGNRLSYKKMLTKAGIESRSDRKAQTRQTRPPSDTGSLERLTSFAVAAVKCTKTDRLKLSPHYVMRRHLNGKLNEPIQLRMVRL